MRSLPRSRSRIALGEPCITVLVPEENLDEAHVIIESQDTYDDIYDMGMDEDEEDGEYEDRMTEEED